MNYNLPLAIKNLVNDAKKRCNSPEEEHILMHYYGVQDVLQYVSQMEKNDSQLIRDVFLVPYYNLLQGSLYAALSHILFQRYFLTLKDSRKAERESSSQLQLFWNDVMSFQKFKEYEEDRNKKQSKKL